MLGQPHTHAEKSHEKEKAGRGLEFQQENTSMMSLQ